MKKFVSLMFVLSLYLLYGNSMAVSNTINPIVIVIPETINPYETIWDAIAMAESDKNSSAFNPNELATGIVQIRPIRLLDYNQRTGSNYTLNDCFNVQISKKIFMYYAMQFLPTEYDKIATDWNKCKTTAYWERVIPHI